MTDDDHTQGDEVPPGARKEPESGEGDNVVRVDFGARARSGERQTRREIPIPKAENLPKDPTAPQKLEAFSKLIELGMTMVTVDSRRPGVVVPPIHQGELQLNLNFSLRFGIEDFNYDDDDVRASLSFGGVPHLCILPWSAVYMIRSHVTDDVAVFPNDLPPELHAAAAAEMERLRRDAERTHEPPMAVVVDNEASAPELSVADSADAPESLADDDEEEVTTAPQPIRPGLRLVKAPPSDS